MEDLLAPSGTKGVSRKCAEKSTEKGADSIGEICGVRRRAGDGGSHLGKAAGILSRGLRNKEVRGRRKPASSNESSPEEYNIFLYSEYSKITIYGENNMTATLNFETDEVAITAYLASGKVDTLSMNRKIQPNGAKRLHLMKQRCCNFFYIMFVNFLYLCNPNLVFFTEVFCRVLNFFCGCAIIKAYTRDISCGTLRFSGAARKASRTRRKFV